MIEVKAEALAISTFAGRPPSPGFQDGSVGEATFGWVTGVALDGAGNLYVADASAHAIRKITPEGMVVTIAGKLGESGSANGVGSEARLYSPRAVVVDGEGNVYAAEEWNSTIRKITPGGLVTTFAGMTGQDGTADGMGQEARFNTPRGLAVDGDGNVFVADQGNGRIRRITPEGVVTTLPGAFTAPEGLAVDSAGNIFIGDWRAHRIYKLTAEGSTVLAGSGVAAHRDGQGTMARFYDPTGVGLDAEGNLYVTDTINQAIRKVAPDATVTTVAGLARVSGARNGAAADARFNFPRGVVVDPEGNLFIADSSNFAIRKISPEGVVSTLSGGEGGTEDGVGHEARFFEPDDVAVGSDGTVYVADTGNHSVRKITPSGEVSTLAGLPAWPGSSDGIGEEARFSSPEGIAVDGLGNVYVADTRNNTIRKVTPAGAVSTLAGEVGQAGTVDGIGSEARFFWPTALVVDDLGNLFVTDDFDDVIRKITPEGVVTTFAGEGGEAGTADGVGTNARFNAPNGIAVDDAGNLYVADRSNHLLRKITPEGVVTTVAGIPGMAGNLDGDASSALLNSPNGVAVTPSGDLLVVESSGASVRKVTPEGVVSTVAGMARSRGNSDGTGSDARFNLSSGIASHSDGTVYIADTLNHTIRKGVPGPSLVPPAIHRSLEAQSAAVGIDLLLRVEVTGGLPWNVQWFRDGVELLGATNPVLVLRNVTGLAAGDYSVVVSNPGGTAESLSPAIVSVEAGVEIDTLAGQEANPGSADGAGQIARFNDPRGMVIDPAGTVYVADTYNNVIRKITPEGVVSTLAGLGGAWGSADGKGSEARFSHPVGIDMDGAGTIFVADSSNGTVRKINPDGQVSTFAGLADSAGDDDGVGSEARFHQPAGLAIDGAGNIFIADVARHVIRRIQPDGTVTTFSGRAGSSGNADGSASQTRFRHPYGVAVDLEGNVYVADTINHLIRKITPDGISSRVAGSGIAGHADGSAGSARFDRPQGIAVDPGGRIYVADTFNHVIRLITPDGHVLTVAGMPESAGGEDGRPGVARFRTPFGLAVDAQGTLHIADSGNHTIRVGTVTPLAAPPLNTAIVGNQIAVSWPLWGGDLKLESADSVGPQASWSDVAGERTPSGDYLSVTADIGSGSQFFRLVRP